MAKKVILKSLDDVDILPITRAELVLDNRGQPAFRSESFLATDQKHGLMSSSDKTTLQKAIVIRSTSNGIDVLESSNRAINPQTVAKAVLIDDTDLETYLKNNLVLDDTPTEGNTNHSVSSDGIYKELQRTVGDINSLLQNI